MRIQIFTQFFSPEVGATQSRLHTFAEGLAARGHDVEVICEVPNHPQGVIHPGWGGKPVRRHRFGSFRSFHVWVYTRPEKSTANRLLFYGTYAALGALVGSARPRPDVIFASSPPLPVAAAAAAAAKRHRVPWVMDVRDLWPDAATALGELSNPRMLALAERLEKYLYRDAAAITAVTEPFREHIARLVADPEKVAVVPNGTTRFWLDALGVDAGRESLDLPRTGFLWTYAGNIGPAQGLDAAVAAAGLLQDGYRLLMLGDGASRQHLEELAREVAPGKVLFRSQVDPGLARAYLRASDCLLVPLAEHPSLAAFVPSKLFDFCAVGRPVVVAAAGEPHRLASESDAALTVAPGDAAALARAVERIRHDPDLGRRLADNGREFAARNLRDAQIDRLESILAEAAR
jgi:glycosyltransferase involved in cell wall biosynthesis